MSKKILTEDGVRSLLTIIRDNGSGSVFESEIKVNFKLQLDNDIDEQFEIKEYSLDMDTIPSIGGEITVTVVLQRKEYEVDEQPEP